MIKSMTGYGRTSQEDERKKISIELRCLNSKQFDFSFRSSGAIREKETEIRTLVSNILQRGKVDKNIYYENLEDPAVPTINKKIILNYYDQLSRISDKNSSVKLEELLPVIMRLPDVLKSEKQELKNQEWVFISDQIRQVLTETDGFRIQEGKSLEKDIVKRTELISRYLEQIPQFEGERIEKIKSRIKDRLNELNLGGEVDENRFEQEMVFYIEKFDITEEKVRLKNHLEYFISSINVSEPVGKKLGFIAQEMGREINTIGSKANNSDIQKIVVRMKDELEKIKEQLLNVL